MTFRHTLLTKSDVTLGANKTRTLLLLIDLVIEYSTIIQSRSHMTTIGATAGANRHFKRLRIRRVHLRGRMAVCASEIRMRAALVAKPSRRDTLLPGAQNEAVLHPHGGSNTRIEVTVNFYRQIRRLVTYLTIRRDRRNSRLRIVTGEASRMTVWNRLERTLFQPELIA